MNISSPFIARPIATTLLMVGLLLLGLAAYPLLPVASLPNVNYPTISVTAQLPGADPQTMASSVATPLEEQFGQIPGITQMTSSSALGTTAITLQFDLSRDIEGAATDTLAAINAAGGQLPPAMIYPPTSVASRSPRSASRSIPRRSPRAASPSKTSAMSSARPMSTCRKAPSTARARPIRSTPTISC
jgi:multidrug efflux pump subunit AcrB